MPDPKHIRSKYSHWDSTEPDMWARLVALFHGIVGTVSISGQPIQTQTDGTTQPVSFADGPNLDAFYRLRVSNPTGLFDSQNQYDLNRILWQNKITDNSGNATAIHHPNGADVELTVDATDTIIRQTREYFRYQPGKSQFILVTFDMDDPNIWLTQEVGYFDDENGVFFQDEGGELAIVLRSNVSGTPDDKTVPQAQWNIDTLDGTGSSGITLDQTKSQIFLVDLEWLGVGRVRTGFVIDGVPIYVHEFLHANISNSVYMTTANLPIRYRIAGGVGLPSTKTMHCICAQVSSEGGFELSRGLVFASTNGNVSRSCDSTGLPIVAIRPKALFNSITNRGQIVPENFSMFSEDSVANVRLIWGASVTGGAWVSLNDDSLVEYNITGTGISGGIVVASEYVPATNQSKGTVSQGLLARYPLALDIDGALPTSPYSANLVLHARSFSGSTDCAGTIVHREIR